MPRWLRFSAVWLLVFMLAGGALRLAGPRLAFAAPDQEVASGRFFSQAGPGDGSGYFILDDGLDARGHTIRFWTEFQRLGGVDSLGYPISRHFTGNDGYTYQAFQRGVLQWRPEREQAVLANTYEWLQQAGRDDWLANLGVPRPIGDDGSGGDWSRAVETRLSWLTEPRIRDKFLASTGGEGDKWRVEDSIQLYGLPMSGPERRGPFVVQRFQRIAFQLWLDNVPGMPSAGTVVGVLGGDMLKQAGLVDATAASPESLQRTNGPAARVTPASAGTIKGVYLSSQAVGLNSFRQSIFDLASTTEVNGVVVDYKGERGLTTFPSDVPLATEIGASARPSVAEAASLIAQFRQRGIYVIARITVFKDGLLPLKRPELAVVDTRNGQPWRDEKNLAWANPFRQEVWDYNIALAKEAARRGFDEVQFDFIRFPADGSIGFARFDQPDPSATRTAAIEGFLSRARAELQPLGVKIAADLFGHTAWRQTDTSIGQVLEGMARSLDVVSPMLYPSTFLGGIPGYRPGVVYPYEVVLQSTQRAVERLKGTGVVVRPWLQDFPDYSYDKRPYTAKEVAAQIRGAMEGGAAGWMLWNSGNRYTRDALGPK